MNRATMLFHYQLGFPARAQLRFGTKTLYWTKHALAECSADRYGIINPPNELDTDKAQVIEAELSRLDDGSFYTHKVVYRIPYTETKDMVIVFVPSSGAVKTVWINMKEDTHRTLNTKKYWTPEGVDWFYSGQFGKAPPHR